MGYTHYWYRELEIPTQKFQSIRDDFKKLLPEFQKLGIKLGNSFGKGKPVINEDEIAFNGLRNCGHIRRPDLIIPWPSETAGGVFGQNQIVGDWFGGALIGTRLCDGDCSYESFCFPRILKPKERETPVQPILCYSSTRSPIFVEDKRTIGKYFDCCKAAYRPYDIAVTAFLIIAKHYLKNRLIVHSDGEEKDWFDGKLLCQINLGYGMDFRIDHEQGQ